MATWITSDLHLNDPNMLLTSRQQFKTLEEHDEYVIQQYNSVVENDDLVYILGDLGFTPKDRLTTLVRRLKGRKMLITGNHDLLTDTDYQKMGIAHIFRHPVYYSNSILLSHIPVKECFQNPWCVNIHGHLHQSRLKLSNYFNVNTELNGFKPYDLKILSQNIETLYPESRYEPFKTEWYAPYEQSLLPKIKKDLKK